MSENECESEYNDNMNESEYEETVEFDQCYVPLLNHDDYEILNQYPFNIRRKDNHYEVKESDYRKNGYICVHLNGKLFYKHRLIALQFIFNPNNLSQIDHINHDRMDYHLENLRFVNSSTNQMNKKSSGQVIYEYVKSIPDESICVNNYNEHEFEDYYYYDNVFYFFNGIQYRKLHINESKCGSLYVYLMNTNGNRVCVYYSKFKKLHDLI